MAYDWVAPLGIAAALLGFSLGMSTEPGLLDASGAAGGTDVEPLAEPVAAPTVTAADVPCCPSLREVTQVLVFTGQLRTGLCVAGTCQGGPSSDEATWSLPINATAVSLKAIVRWQGSSATDQMTLSYREGERTSSIQGRSPLQYDAYVQAPDAQHSVSVWLAPPNWGYVKTYLDQQFTIEAQITHRLPALPATPATVAEGQEAP